MPKKKVYTISQITDAFYAGVSPEKIVKMAQTLIRPKKVNIKKRKV